MGDKFKIITNNFVDYQGAKIQWYVLIEDFRREGSVYFFIIISYETIIMQREIMTTNINNAVEITVTIVVFNFF